jgi:hypothetical protein
MTGLLASLTLYGLVLVKINLVSHNLTVTIDSFGIACYKIILYMQYTDFLMRYLED